MNIILLGSPGAGKDTLADQLVEKYNYTVITTGAIFREEFERGTELGIKAKNEYWGKGKLCPDHITDELVKNTIDRLPKPDNIIFNGYPRSINQARYLKTIVDIHIVIKLLIEEDAAVKRLLKRGRLDDTKEIIRQRIIQYNQKTTPVMSFYKGMGFYKNVYYEVINADQSPENTL